MTAVKDIENGGESCEKREWAPYMRQLYMVVLVCMSMFTSGATLAFPSVIVSDVAKNHENFWGHRLELSKTEQDLLGSLTAFGGIFGVAVAAMLVGRLGRRRLMA